MDEFSARTRTADLAAMADRPLDLLVVGGGIVGSWVALAAVLRGYRVGLVEEGDVVPFGGREFLVAHTPGHTPGCVSYIAGKMAFVGDLIFAGSIGRTDLPGGNHKRLIESVRKKIFPLPDDTVLYPGHGPATTVGEEKRSNPFF